MAFVNGAAGSFEAAVCDRLMRAVAAGEKQRFQELIALLWPELVRLVRGSRQMVARRSDDDVHDVVAALVEKLSKEDHRALGQYVDWSERHPDKQLQDWLRIAATNAVRDHFRSQLGRAAPDQALPSAKQLLNAFTATLPTDELGTRPPRLAARGHAARWPRIAPLIAAALLSLACSSSDTGQLGGAAGAGQGAAAGQGGAAAAGQGGAAAAAGLANGGSGGGAGAFSNCAALDAVLSQALSAAREQAGSVDGILSVRTPTCGARTYVDGPTGLSGEELFRIGSVTKTYVAAAALRLVELGKLDLDAHIDAWVPSIPNAESISVRMTLNHTSGIFNYTTDATFLADLKKKRTPQELVQIAAAHPSTHSPGTAWKYSNTNYIVVGIIVEAVSGQGIEAFIRSELLTPQVLSGTFLDGSEALEKPLVPGFGANGSDQTYAVDPTAVWAAGSMTATPADAARWIALLAGGSVLGAAAQAELTSSVPAATPSVRYGLGLVELDAGVTGGAGPGRGHDGSINGYRTHAFYFPDIDVAVASFFNRDGADPNLITAAALSLLAP